MNAPCKWVKREWHPYFPKSRDTTINDIDIITISNHYRQLLNATAEHHQRSRTAVLLSMVTPGGSHEQHSRENEQLTIPLDLLLQPLTSSVHPLTWQLFFCNVSTAKQPEKNRKQLILSLFPQILTPQNNPMQNGRQHVTPRKIL